MSEDFNQLSKPLSEYGIMTSNVNRLQEAVDLVNRCLVTVAYGLGTTPEVTVVMQEGLLSGPVSQIVVTPRWYRPKMSDERS